MVSYNNSIEVSHVDFSIVLNNTQITDPGVRCVDFHGAYEHLSVLFVTKPAFLSILKFRFVRWVSNY